MPLSNYISSSRISQPGVCTSTTRPISPYEGQMIYEIDTDMLVIWNGTSWRYIAATTSINGAVLQVVNNQPSFSDQAISSTTETMFVNNLASITPKSASSRILIFFTFGGYPTNFANYYDLFIRRGAVGNANKIASNGGTWGEWSHNFQVNSSGSFGTSAHQNYNIHAWDNAATTSTITYSLTGKNSSGSTGSFILWSGASNNRITLMEIAG